VELHSPAAFAQSMHWGEKAGAEKPAGKRYDLNILNASFGNFWKPPVCS
jgi:hypothetical protein